MTQTDDLVCGALAALDDDARTRHMIDVRHFVDHMADVARRGELCGDLANEYRMEADVRRDIGDPTWPVWQAWSESLALRAATCRMEWVE